MKRFFVFLAVLTLFFLSIFLVWRGIYSPKDMSPAEEKIFSIEQGWGGKEIAFNLENDGLIRNRFLFLLYLLTTGKSGNLQAGDYLLSSSMAVPEIVKKIASGDVIKEKIIIIEGWNLRDIGFYFENKGMFQPEELWELVGFPAVDYSKETGLPAAASAKAGLPTDLSAEALAKAGLPNPKDFSAEFDFLKDKPKNLGLEGYLFPDTYFIKNTNFSTIEEKLVLTKAERIVRKMLENFGQKLTAELREEIARQNKTIFQTITMASLIEKEVRTLEDKKLVSGILWKRLKVGMPLQVDACVGYITGKRTTAISIEETKIDSPYNTYKYRGLPLGPICNPGIDSILTAIEPKESDYWYYLSTPEGETIFSRTLEEHNIAKAKHLK